MKKVLSLLLALAMMFALVACGGNNTTTNNTTGNNTGDTTGDTTGDSTDGETYEIAAMFYKYDDVYLSTVRSAMEKYAEEAGNINLTCYDGQGDQGKQLDQLDTILAKGVDCIFVNMTDQSSAPTVIDKVKDEGIPLVFFNREPTDITVLEGYDKCLFVGTQAEDAGIMQGDMLYDLWTENPDYDRNGDGKVQYVVFQGEADNVEAIARTEYCVKQSEENGLQMEAIAETQVCNWLAEQAMNAMEAILATQADTIEVAFCNNDDMATGVISALQNNGMNTGNEGDPSIIVLGVDATDAGVAAVEAGTMAGTVKQDGDGMAKAVVEVALNFLAGNDPLEGTDYELDSTGVAIRIPYSPYYAE